MKKQTFKALGLFALVATLGLSVATPAHADWYGRGYYHPYYGRYAYYHPYYPGYYGAGYYGPAYVTAPVPVAYAAPAPYYAPVLPIGLNVGVRIR